MKKCISKVLEMKKWIPIVILILMGYFFFPVSILKHVDDGFVHFVRCNPNFETGEPEYNTIEISEEAKQKVLECLSRYREYRTLSFEQGYSLSNMELEIYIQDGKESKTIVLGNINYSVRTYGTQKHGIYNANALREELLEILGLTGHAEKS